jgi:hypothetical protein
MTKIMITGLVLVHLAASLWHGSAHTHLGIELSTEQTLFVYLPPGTPESHSQFITSACVIALVELASTLYGAFCPGTYHAQERTRA